MEAQRGVGVGACWRSTLVVGSWDCGRAGLWEEKRYVGEKGSAASGSFEEVRVFRGKGLRSAESLRLLNALNREDRGLKVRFSLVTIVFETFEPILCQMLSSQGKNAPSNPYPHYLVRLATSRVIFNFDLSVSKDCLGGGWCFLQSNLKSVQALVPENALPSPKTSKKSLHELALQP